MDANVMEYVRPELLILVPVLLCIGGGMKKAAFVKDGHIPLLLGGAGVLCALLWVLATSDVTGYRDVLMSIFVALTQGVLCAGCAVYVNQIGKQAVKEKEGKNVEHYSDTAEDLRH